MVKIKFHITIERVLKVFALVILEGIILNCYSQKNDSNCINREIFKDSIYKADYIKTFIGYYIDGTGNIEYFKNDTLELSWYSNGACRSERHYKYGQTSLVKTWWENGLVQSIYLTNELWNDRKVCGSTDHKVIYAALENGEIMVENGNGYYNLWGERGFYKDTLRIGTWTKECNGIITKINYKKGIRHGSYERLTAENILVYRASYKNGKHHGYWQSWYTNGRKHAKGKYKNEEFLTLSFWTPKGKKTIRRGNGIYFFYDDYGQPNPYSKLIKFKGGKERK